jgi:DHA3 family macrolide efflux protein-like MFS transporter
MLVDVGTATLAILPLLFAHVPQPRRDDTGTKGAAKPSIWTDMQEGLRYILVWPGLMALIGAAMIVRFALTPAFSLVPLLVSEHFNGGAAQFSQVEAVAGVGVVVGGLVLSVWGGFRRKIYTWMLGIVGLGLGLVVLGLTPGGLFWIALVCAFVVGSMIPIVDGPLMAIIQGTVAPEMQGRVFTLMGSLVRITAPFSLAIAGPVSDRFGLQVWYLTAGTLCGVAGLSGFFVPAIVNIEENANRTGTEAEPLS